MSRESMEERLDLTASLLASAMLAGDQEGIKRNLFRLTAAGMELDKLDKEENDANTSIL